MPLTLASRSTDSYMATSSAHRFDPPTSGLNIVPFAIMAGGWLAPLIMFWLYVWGLLRPFAYPSGPLLPEAWFLVVIAACLALWWLLPRAYFRVHPFERMGQVYKALGVPLFRRYVPDADLADRWERRREAFERSESGAGPHVEETLPGMGAGLRRRGWCLRKGAAARRVWMVGGPHHRPSTTHHL